VILFLSILILLLLVAAFLFVFNPLGLGPEPQRVLPEDFFTKPHRDLNGLELLIDGEEAFHRIVELFFDS